MSHLHSFDIHKFRCDILEGQMQVFIRVIIILSFYFDVMPKND